MPIKWIYRCCQSDQWIFLQVGHIVEWRERVKLEEQPADVSMKEALGNAVRVFIVIDMLMVGAMFACPQERRVFKCRRPRK